MLFIKWSQTVETMVPLKLSAGTVVDVTWPSQLSEIFIVLIPLGKKQTVSEIVGDETLIDSQSVNILVNK